MARKPFWKNQHCVRVHTRDRQKHLAQRSSYARRGQNKIALCLYSFCLVVLYMITSTPPVWADHGPPPMVWEEGTPRVVPATSVQDQGPQARDEDTVEERALNINTRMALASLERSQRTGSSVPVMTREGFYQSLVLSSPIVVVQSSVWSGNASQMLEYLLKGLGMYLLTGVIALLFGVHLIPISPEMRLILENPVRHFDVAWTVQDAKLIAAEQIGEQAKEGIGKKTEKRKNFGERKR